MPPEAMHCRRVVLQNVRRGGPRMGGRRHDSRLGGTLAGVLRIRSVAVDSIWVGGIARPGHR